MMSSVQTTPPSMRSRTTLVSLHSRCQRYRQIDLNSSLVSSSPCEGTISKHCNLESSSTNSKSPIDYFQPLLTEKPVGCADLDSAAGKMSPMRQLSDGLRNPVVFSRNWRSSTRTFLFHCRVYAAINNKSTQPETNLLIAWIWLPLMALAQAIKEFEGGVVIVSYDCCVIGQVPEEIRKVAVKKFGEASNGNNEAPTPQTTVIVNDGDQSHKSSLKGKDYLAPVSPWFLTHFAEVLCSKNWVFLSDLL
ncbi:hypothetical protein K435DRAFT_837535 [Dendrothele bispora CBS 962.96]|uniref:Uncharacterized protein n=1 Tax=Dendrothele bispora (strain CBS 962.96) TaxID=1314807 RepID=A0A4S8MBC4_DENBC|nr:hypothetical protein K435DRAFT_837535 [Dendrothele bispora CBS 962.96]